MTVIFLKNVSHTLEIFVKIGQNSKWSSIVKISENVEILNVPEKSKFMYKIKINY